MRCLPAFAAFTAFTAFTAFAAFLPLAAFVFERIAMILPSVIDRVASESKFIVTESVILPRRRGRPTRLAA